MPKKHEDTKDNTDPPLEILLSQKYFVLLIIFQT